VEQAQSVSVEGEAVVAPGARIRFKYNYCLFINAKVCVVWWLPQMFGARGVGSSACFCTIFCTVW
jgi:hypothetical protein